MRGLIVLAAACLLAIPPAAASHWDDDNPGTQPVGNSSCHPGDPVCVAGYACTDGAPPQAVDFILHCLGRLASEADDIAESYPFYAWELTDGILASAGQVAFGTVPSALEGPVTQVNFVLCSQVWSFFCTNPIVVPDHAPVPDPVEAYPL